MIVAYLFQWVPLSLHDQNVARTGTGHLMEDARRWYIMDDSERRIGEDSVPSRIRSADSNEGIPAMESK